MQIQRTPHGFDWSCECLASDEKKGWVYLGVTTRRDSIEELFEHAAPYVARFDQSFVDQSFVEGIGNVGYTELLEDIETEIVA